MQGCPGADPVPDFATSPRTDDDGHGTGASPRRSATYLATSSSDAESFEVDYEGHPLQSEIEEIPSPLWLSPLRPRWPPIRQPQSLKIRRVKVVLMVDFHDKKVMQKALNKFRSILLGGKPLGTSYDVAGRRKAMRSLVMLAGIDSIAVDMKDKRMTVIGVADPLDIVGKLRKFWHTEILSIGPAKEPKKEEPKKEEPKKEEEEDSKKKEEKKEAANEMLFKYSKMLPGYEVYGTEEDQRLLHHDYDCRSSSSSSFKSSCSGKIQRV